MFFFFFLYSLLTWEASFFFLVTSVSLTLGLVIPGLGTSSVLKILTPFLELSSSLTAFRNVARSTSSLQLLNILITK